MATPPFGQQLKHFRRMRGMSQLDLAFAAGVSPRHISFIETGRSKPSEDMVLKVAESLGIPLREQNTLLRSAGYAALFPARRLDEPALAPMRRIIERLLTRHEPYPGFVIDRYWDIVQLNRPARQLFSELLPKQLPNAIDLFLGPGPMRELVENWREIAWHTLHRLRREAADVSTDAKMTTLLQRAERYMEDVPMPQHLDVDAPGLTTKLDLGECKVNTVSTIASFNVARDVTVDELRVELVFPADDAADAFFHQAAQSGGKP